MGARQWVVVVGAVVAFGGAEASAQVCGDADASGAVTVTDGVQALRAAAGLETTCAAGRCDVDGSGAVTVTDGVNVLRKAAGVAISEACPVASTTESVRAVLGEMTKIARVPGAQAAARAAGSGGTRVDCDEGFFTVDGGTSTFVDCRYGEILLNGAITTTTVLSDPDAGRFIRSDVYEDYSVVFLDGGFTFRQSGTSRVELNTKTNTLIEDGTVTITTAQSATGQDTYTLTKVNLTTDFSTGTVTNGKLITALAEAGLAAIKSVTLGYVSGNVADVDVEFDDGHSEAFDYDILTGDLTPASNANLAALHARGLRREREELDVPRRARV